jgi:hypothetical protein
MDRRHFFASSIAIIAASGLPTAKRKKPGSATIYRTVLLQNTPKQYHYELSVYHEALTNLPAAAEIDKVITMRAKYYEKADFAKPTKSSEFKYIIKSSTFKDGNYDVKTKFDQKTAGDLKLPDDFPKDITFRINQYVSVKILSKKNVELLTIPYPTSSTSDDDMDCFLTTACVHHKKLADDCIELNTLRDLRDNFILRSDEGKDLIANYEMLGPSLVQSINSCENSSEIFEYMYDQLVIPSVEMVKEGKKEEAVDYYRNFVQELTTKYL